jgi:hypothetical protein
MVPEAELKPTEGGLEPAGDRARVRRRRRWAMRDPGVGTRAGGGVVYPRSELALKYDAGVKQEITEPGQAYAGLADDAPSGYRTGWLPGA